MNNIFKISTLTLFFVFLDLYTKNIAIEYLSNWNINLFLWIKLILWFNEWIAFSLPITGLLQIILSFVLLFILIYYAIKNWDLWNFLVQFSLSLIMWWAIWNLYERILFWKVTDFISIFSWFPIFNFADVYIFIWVVIILLFESKIWNKIFN